MNFNAETYIALASAIVSLCALGATIWQGRQNYKHNKLSVRPYLGTFEYQDIKTDKIGRLTFTLINCGIGPAIVKNFILLFDGKEVSRNNFKTYNDFFKQKLEGYGDVNVCTYAPSSAIQIGERLELLGFDYIMGKQDISFADKLNIVVEYQSIYQDEVFTYDSRKDRRFHGKEVLG